MRTFDYKLKAYLYH